MYAKKREQWLAALPQPPRTMEALTANSLSSIQALESLPIKHTPANHHLFFSAVVHWLKKDHPLYAHWHEIQTTNWANRPPPGAPTPLQTNKTTTQEEINHALTRLPPGQPRLLLSLYTQMEPVRADLFATEIVAHDAYPTEDNYVQLSDPLLAAANNPPKLVLRDFKTSKRYTTIERDLPPHIQSELTSSLAIEPRRYLFVHGSPQRPYTRKEFSNWATRTLTAALGRPMTLTALRHLYISSLDFNRPIAELETIAHNMGHSIGMQKRYQWA